MSLNYLISITAVTKAQSLHPQGSFQHPISHFCFSHPPLAFLPVPLHQDLLTAGPQE